MSWFIRAKAGGESPLFQPLSLALGYQSIAASQLQMCIHVAVKGNSVDSDSVCGHLAAGRTSQPASIVTSVTLHEPGPILQGLGDELGQAICLSH